MRMNQFFSVLAVGVIASIVGSATADVVNFDDLVGSGPVPNGYGNVDVWTGWTHYDSVQPPYNPHSPPTRIYNTSDGTFRFGRGVEFEGAWFAGHGTSRGFLPISFDLYLNNNLVHSSDEIDLLSDGVPTWLGSGYTGAVDTVVVNGSPGFYVMDDVTFHELGGFRISVTGDCPGTVSVAWTGGNPNGATQGLVIGQGLGQFTIPQNQPCGGTVLGITGQVQLVNPPGLFNNQGGNGSISGRAGTAACGRYVQMVEGGSCIISNPAQLP